MGIVHHASFIIYFEEGRSNYARMRGASYVEFERQGFVLAVAEIHARYVKSVRYDQRITVRTWIESLRSRSVAFGYEIANAETGDLFVTGLTKHLCLTRDGKVALLPESWRAWTDT